MPYHTIQVSRLFDVVTQQVLELDEAWLEDTVRTAIGSGAGCGGTRLPGADPSLGVKMVAASEPVPRDDPELSRVEEDAEPVTHRRGSRGSGRNSMVARRRR